MTDKSFDYLTILTQFASKRVLVIGDFMLDIYLKGVSTRLSPEAPVPVVDVQDTTHSAGGAANTALNLCTLNAHVIFLSVAGDDDEGNAGMGILREHGIETSGFICHKKRKTISKTRVMSGSHVLLRLDKGTDSKIDTDTEQILLEHLDKHVGTIDAVLISDYNKGVLTETIVGAIKTITDTNSIPIIVDSKRLHFFSSLCPTIVKPNYEEAISLFELTRKHYDRPKQFKDLGETVFSKTQARITAVTLDAEGAVVFEGDQCKCHVPAPVVSSPCVSGAGDTFISAFTLAWLVHPDIHVAADIAVAAAAIVIASEMTAHCSHRELKYHLSPKHKYVSTLNDLEEICLMYHTQKKKIVFTNGCFDILHSGHINYLRQAKELGDVLIIGVNDDASIRRLKGAQRPVNPLSDRLEVLAALSAVDHIISFGAENDDTPVSLISVVRPHVFAKGGDYHYDKLPEAETIEKCGGRIVFLPYLEDHSTSRIIRRIHDNRSVNREAVPN